MGQNTFTKFQWMQEAIDLMTKQDEELSIDDWSEILDVLWDHLPPNFHSKVIKALEKKYT